MITFELATEYISLHLELVGRQYPRNKCLAKFNDFAVFPNFFFETNYFSDPK